MITFFSIPKAFKGHIEVIQTNAIRSWARLPGCEVILFGEEEGLTETAAALNVRHVADIRRNEHGTPLVSDAFEKVRHLAKKPLLAYINADIMLTSGMLRAARLVEECRLGDWLMVGRRHDLDVKALFEFDEAWEDRLRADVLNRGVLHGLAGIDYFVFPRASPLVLPELAVGRPGWDGWMIYRARATGVPVIDATAAVLAVHQNHPPAYSPYAAEARQNTYSAGGVYRMGTLRDADWRIGPLGNANMVLSKRWAGIVMFLPLVRLLLGAKRMTQARLGLWRRWRH
jgi:hypothetical protein